MSKIQAVRDQLERGDTVFVKQRNQGCDGEIGKPRKAKIVELMGNAAACQFDDGHREIVVLKRLSKAVEHETEQPKPLATKPVVVTPPPTQQPTAAPPPKAQDDVTTWLEMGRALGVQMRAKIESLRDDAAELRIESTTLLELAKSREAESDQLEKQLEDIERIAGAKR